MNNFPQKTNPYRTLVDFDSNAELFKKLYDKTGLTIISKTLEEIFEIEDVKIMAGKRLSNFYGNCMISHCPPLSIYI